MAFLRPLRLPPPAAPRGSKSQSRQPLRYKVLSPKTHGVFRCCGSGERSAAPPRPLWCVETYPTRIVQQHRTHTRTPSAGVGVVAENKKPLRQHDVMVFVIGRLLLSLLRTLRGREKCNPQNAGFCAITVYTKKTEPSYRLYSYTKRTFANSFPF